MTDTTAGEGVTQWLWRVPGRDWVLANKEDDIVREVRVNRQWVKTEVLPLTAQPSAGAQGEAVAWRLNRRCHEGWNLWDTDPRLEDGCDYADASKWTVQALAVIDDSTPAQPDTGAAEALREALTPSGDTKAAYSGEFKFQVTQWRENEDPDSDDEMEEYLADFTVPWTTIKEIMAAISKRAALSTANTQGAK